MTLDRTLRRLALAALVLLVSACGADRTSIQIQVTSSTLVVGEDLDRLQFQVEGRQSGQMLEETFELDRGDWPQSLTVLPGENDREQVTITVRAYLVGDGEEPGELVTTVTRNPTGTPPCDECRFVPGEVQEVLVTLEVEPVTDGGMDGGRDGGVDGGRDAGDGGFDAGDGGCADDRACDDGIECTVDRCTGGACENIPDDSVCEEGSTCDPTMGCPLVPCTADVDCNDDDPCNGVETCVDDLCRRGESPAERCNGMDDDCDDAVDEDFDCVQGESGLECTTTCGSTGTRRCDADCGFTSCEPPVESCNEADDDCDGVVDEGFACLSCTEDIDCDDGDPCNGAETCNDRGNCEAGTAPSCDDGIRCTVDSCDADDPDAAENGCVNTPDDAFCDDDNFCNGTETCSATGCQPGMPADCDDGDDCTDDSCTGTMPGSCTHTTVDLDGDGFGDASCAEAGGVPATDCDDTNDAVNPDATETCNGRDDDCDGMVDEDFDCEQGGSVSCTTSCDTTGTRACSDTCTLSDTCTPPPEACNGVDDDCDGMVDETVECSVGEMGSCTTSCGSTGTQQCRSDCTWSTCEPPAEMCNGLDDDCDALIDEDFTCVPGSTRNCTSSCSTSGQQTCQMDCTWGTCEPFAESCNGLDDDCDGVCDNGFACCAGSSGTCTTSCGTTGTRTCNASCGWSACSPPAETCNGVDDDCNDVCDDGFACCAGLTDEPCTTSCGSTGTRDCQSDCTWTSCTPPAETCSGDDDDCDGMVDEDFACVQGETESCTTTCDSTGTRTCQGDCTWSSCMPPAEACGNGADDDCDGDVDEGCTGGCTTCTGSTTVGAPGGRFTVSLGADAEAGSCGGSGGSEAYLNFDLTEASDVFISTHNTLGLDTVVYVRECTCGGTELGCNDDADGRSTSVLQLTSLPAGTYNVIVDTKAAMSVDVDVDVYFSAAGMESDRCGYPGVIPASGTGAISGTTCGYGDDYDVATGTCGTSSSGNGEERVFYFVVGSSGTVGFDTCNSGTDYDPTIYSRAICANAAASNQIDCNEDACGGSPGCGSRYRSSMSTTMSPGLYYYFMDGYDFSGTCPCGNFSVDVTGL